jgi:hypothetical protein
VFSNTPGDVRIRISICSAVRIVRLVPKLIEEQGDGISLTRQNTYYRSPKAAPVCSGYVANILPVVVCMKNKGWDGVTG